MQIMGAKVSNHNQERERLGSLVSLKTGHLSARVKVNYRKQKLITFLHVWETRWILFFCCLTVLRFVWRITF